jgi:hypothetical protein
MSTAIDQRTKELAIAASGKIIEKVKTAFEAKDSEKRWFWELAQNAKDTVVGFDQKVDITLRIEKRDSDLIMEFVHNGQPFKPSKEEYRYDDPLCLLLADSGKYEEGSEERKNLTGQFGTGFLSTHILSLLIEVRGVFLKDGDNAQKFSFFLDRRFTKRKDLVPKVEKAITDYESGFSPVSPHDDSYLTVFRYYLNETRPGKSGEGVLEIGLESISKYLSYVLLFSPEIDNIKIEDQRSEDVYEYSSFIEVLKDSVVQIKQFSLKKDGTENKRLILAEKIVNDELIQLAIPVEIDDKRVIPISVEHTILFCVFPLIGSESFRYPLVINNGKFHPETERNGLNLITGKDSGNQERLEYCIPIFEALVDFLVWENYEGLYFLADTSYDQVPDWVDKEWFDAFIERTQLMLLEKIMLKNSVNDRVKLKDSFITFVPKKDHRDEFWEICFPIIGKFMPLKLENDLWLTVAKEYDKHNLRFNLKSLFEKISDLGTLQKLADSAFSSDEVSAIDWINKLIEFTLKVEADSLELFKEFAVIPNRDGVFYEIGNNNHLLVTDSSNRIPREVTEVYTILSRSDYYFHLIHEKIIFRDATEIPIFDLEVIGNKISEILDTTGRNDRPEIREAVFILSSIFPQNKELIEGLDLAYLRKLNSFARSIFSEIPSQTDVDCKINIWRKSNIKMEFFILDKILELGSLAKLNAELKQMDGTIGIDAASWLNEFLGLVIKNGRNLEKFAVIPNLRGDFKLLNDLYWNSDIPELLIDITGEKWNAEWNFRNILIHSEITCLQNRTPKTVADLNASNIKLLKILLDPQNHNTYWSDNSGNYKVLFRYLNISSIAHHGRDELFNYSKLIFPDLSPENQEIIEGISEFDFSLSDDWAVDQIVNLLAQMKDLTGAKTVLSFLSDMNDSEIVIWLDNLYKFLVSFKNGKYEKKLLSKPVFLNKNNWFRLKSELNVDNGIPSDLIAITNIKFISDNWKDILLHESFDWSKTFFDKERFFDIKTIASFLMEKLRNYEGDKQDLNFAEFVFLLNQSASVKRYEEYFEVFHQKKDALIVGTLGEGENLANVARLIQNPGYLNVMASIAENSNITPGDLQRIADIADTIGVNKILELAEEKKLEQEKKTFLTSLGTQIEKAFELSFSGFKIERKEIGQDYSIELPDGRVILVEIKSITGDKDYVKMSRKQGRTAFESPELYVLCVVEKEHYTDHGPDYFKKHARFVIDIGVKIKSKVLEAINFEKFNIDDPVADFSIDFETVDYKFKIRKPVWESGLDYDRFEKFISSKVKP